MHHKDFPDIQEILDQCFSAAEEIRNAVANEMGFGEPGKGPNVHWTMYRDYYPAYSYPPLNVYMTADKSMVFQFALAGFGEKDVSLEFRGDYMMFSAKAPAGAEPAEDVRYFKRRLKLKNIAEQKYFVPADKFSHEAATAVMKNAVLTVTVPPKEPAQEPAGKPINIVREDATEGSV
jgi:HSP20 family molecular chaperone IbpA